jgi:hypothetical protein
MGWKILFSVLAQKSSYNKPNCYANELQELRQRNEQRIAQIKADMGEKYILHPSHNKTRLDTPRPV